MIICRGGESPYPKNSGIYVDNKQMTYVLTVRNTSRLRRRLGRVSWSLHYKQLEGGVLACYVNIPKLYENQDEELIYEFWLDINELNQQARDFFTQDFEDGVSFFAKILIVDAEENNIINMRVFTHNDECHLYMTRVFREQLEIKPTPTDPQGLPSLSECVEQCDVEYHLKKEIEG